MRLIEAHGHPFPADFGSSGTFGASQPGMQLTMEPRLRTSGIRASCLPESVHTIPPEYLRNGSYSNVFGRWCGSAADDVLGKVVEHLQSWPNQRCPKMQALQAEVTSHICVVNACKCIHVLKTLSALETGRLALFPNIDCSWYLICPQELCVSRSLCLD